VSRRRTKKQPNLPPGPAPHPQQRPVRRVRRTLWSASLVVSAVLWLFLLLVWTLSVDEQVELNRGLNAEAVVTGLTPAGRGREERVTVSFTDATGRAVSASVLTGLFASSPEIGDRVRVAYRPEEPERARLVGADDLSSISLWLATATVAVVVFAFRQFRS
jgi:hypothetical protein